MDATQALKDTENALRDFISVVLQQLLGDNWVDNCGVSSERVEKWKERKISETSRQRSGVVEERIIYYADFYDLKTILRKHWSGEFSAAFGEWKRMEVLLSELEALRDPDAHRRELMPHQKHLLLGIAGDIRSRLTRYRSKKETSQDCFPRIESVRDSLGNIWVPHGEVGMQTVFTKMTLKPGDQIDFVITASDPEDKELEYGLSFALSSPNKWQADTAFTVTIREENIGRLWAAYLYMRSHRPYHACVDYDDSVIFAYSVLPKQSLELYTQK